MRRTVDIRARQQAQASSFKQIAHHVWRAVAVLFLAAAEAQAQEKLARAALPAVEPKAKAELRIVISISDRKLALLEGDRIVKVYPVAVGAPVSPSPAGEFRIRERITEPTYYAPGKVVSPGKANPLGTRWIGLGHRGYGIHGTNEPRSIGKSVSHGCIRMRNRDVEELFELVRAGDAVELHAKRTTEVAHIFGAAPAAPAHRPAASAAPVVVATVM